MIKNVEEMTLFELSRWCALMEGVNIIADKCDERGQDFNMLELEPLSLRKYVESTCDIICRQMKLQQERDKKHHNQRKALSLSKNLIYNELFDDTPIYLKPVKVI
jgi:hypothetical protein